MSEINTILERRELQAERGHVPSEYQNQHDLLTALDVIADALELIAESLELRNLHDGIFPDRGG